MPPRTLPAVLLALAASAACAADAPGKTPAAAPPPAIGIGKGEQAKETHLMFGGIAKGAKIVRVETRLIVDCAAPKGLNFFAIQVDFPNRTWAHGGPQFNDGSRHEANWGGLVDRGGGSDDYDKTDWTKDLCLIDCGEDKPNTVPWKWDIGREYILTVSRGDRITLPAGTNKAHGGVAVPERAMRVWNFSIVPADGKGEPFTSRLFDSADHIQWFCVWNESGYGSKPDEQHARWTVPVYRVEGSDEDRRPARWERN